MTAPKGSIHRIAADTWRISIALPPELIPVPGGFSFNQYLVVDERPLLFHTGPRKLFEIVRAQIETVLPIAQLRYIAFSHVEADECGSLAEFFALAPQAQPVCSEVAAVVQINDLVDRPALGLKDGDVLDLGSHQLVWQSTPHLPHGWDCGYFFDRTTGVLFCGDLFTQPGTGDEALTRADILGPSEAFRGAMDYFAHGREQDALIEKLATLQPQVLACMHGSAFSGDGAAMLRRLAASLQG